MLLTVFRIIKIWNMISNYNISMVGISYHQRGNVLRRCEPCLCSLMMRVDIEFTELSLNLLPFQYSALFSASY